MKEKLSNITVAILIAVIAIISWYRPAPLSTMAAPDAQLRRPSDFYFEAAAGNILNHSVINKFGQNPSSDSAAEEDIWDGGGSWNEPTTTQVYTFTSTSGNDTSAGTGARTMTIYGLDSNGDLADETLTLAGTGVVTATRQYQMIHRMAVNTAGSGGVNAGVITANANTDGTVTAQINAGNNQTAMAIYKIPSGRQGCIVELYSSLNKSTGATATGDVIIYAKPDGEVWQLKGVLGMSEAGDSVIERDYKPPNCFPALTIIRLAADIDTDNTDVTAGFDMVLAP